MSPLWAVGVVVPGRLLPPALRLLRMAMPVVRSAQGPRLLPLQKPTSVWTLLVTLSC